MKHSSICFWLNVQYTLMCINDLYQYPVSEHLKFNKFFPIFIIMYWILSTFHLVFYEEHSFAEYYKMLV